MTWMKPQNTVWKEDARKQQVLFGSIYKKFENKQNSLVEKWIKQWSPGRWQKRGRRNEGCFQAFQRLQVWAPAGNPQTHRTVRVSEDCSSPLKTFLWFFPALGHSPTFWHHSQDPFVPGQGQTSALALSAWDVALSLPTSSSWSQHAVSVLFMIYIFIDLFLFLFYV